ncbi:MAG TPA: hypothetical protein VJQ57_10065 [Acidimicrobiia bacterium]|nr:hypothetical protein [Acidimicrobiia bacterium]
MKKFVYLFHDQWEPMKEVQDAWLNWFAEIGESVVDSGNPFGPGREVTPTGSKDLGKNESTATGYAIVNADSMEGAEKLLANCPFQTSVRIYEAMAM